MTMEIICTTQQFRGYLMAKDLKELSNLKMS